MIDYHSSDLAFPKPSRKEKSATRQRTGHQSMMEKSIVLSGRIVTHKAVCMRCEKKKLLDPHHIVKRSYKKTAARTDNQIPLCRYMCHLWAEDYPEAFQAWIDEKLPGRRQMLEAVNRCKGRPIWDEIYAKLVQQAKTEGVI